MATKLLKFSDDYIIPVAGIGEDLGFKYAKIFRGEKFIPGDLRSERTHIHNLTTRLSNYSTKTIYIGGGAVDAWLQGSFHDYDGCKVICTFDDAEKLEVPAKELDGIISEDGNFTCHDSVFNVRKSIGRTYRELDGTRDFVLKVADGNFDRLHIQLCLANYDDFKRTFS